MPTHRRSTTSLFTGLVAALLLGAASIQPEEYIGIPRIGNERLTPRFIRLWRMGTKDFLRSASTNPCLFRAPWRSVRFNEVLFNERTAVTDDPLDIIEIE